MKNIMSTETTIIQ